MSPRPTKQSEFDRELIRELARCYARAAIDAMIDENKRVTAIKENIKESKKGEINGKQRTV